MTCIVGLIDNGIVYMGGDSAACDNCEIQIIKEPKVFKKGDFLFGVAGNPRLHDILMYNFEIPEDVRTDPREYLNRDFVPALRECLADNGFLSIEDEVESIESWMLIGYKCRLFMMESNFHIAESARDYNAAGCGSLEALTCLYTLDSIDEIADTSWLTPEIRIEEALGASAAFNCHVRGPFTVIDSSESL